MGFTVPLITPAPGLIQLLEENGFKVIGFHGVGRVPYLWKSMVVVAEKR
jgi:2-polyprenyl-6-hydroxyphenyl methylase/3-demethylubiquinone-9 3-methyltransferase